MRKHGHSIAKTPEYRAWLNMLNRCFNRNHPRYADWGGRGITVCDRWNWRTGGGFGNFLTDLGTKPTQSHTLERKDNSLGYSPDNCVWATRLEQTHNRRKYLTRPSPSQETRDKISRSLKARHA